MSENLCGCCARPVADGSTVCVSCAYRLDEALSSISEYRGLAWDLAATVARQDRIGDRNGGGSPSAETALPFNHRAAQAAVRLTAALKVWADQIAHETGDRAPPVELARLAGWLRPRVGWLRHHERGAYAFSFILDAVREARRVIDRPPDLIYAGPCGAALSDGGGECDEDLYAFPGAAYVTCRGCDTSWDVQERRAWLLVSVEDILATATEISRALTTYAYPVTTAMIRGYVRRQELVARGRNEQGAARYRIGDVVELVTRSSASKSKAS